MTSSSLDVCVAIHKCHQVTESFSHARAKPLAKSILIFFLRKPTMEAIHHAFPSGKQGIHTKTWFNYTRSMIRKYRLIIDIQKHHMYTSTIAKCINVWFSHSPCFFSFWISLKILEQPPSLVPSTHSFSRPPGSGRATCPSARCYAIVVLPPLPHRAAARTSGAAKWDDWKSNVGGFQIDGETCPSLTIEIIDSIVSSNSSTKQY